MVRALVLGALALVTGIPGCSDDAGSEEAFCGQVRSLPPLDSVISSFSDADPGELDTRLEAAAASYGELRKVAPSEIRNSVDDMVDLVDAVLGAVETHREDPEAAVAALRTAVVDHPDAPRSSKRVVDYAAEACGVVLNPTLDAEATDDDAGTTPAPDPGTEAPDGD